MQYLRAAVTYGGDPKLAIKELIENNKGELVCEKYLKDNV